MKSLIEAHHRWVAKMFGIFALLFVGLAACAGDDAPETREVSLSGPSDGGSAVAQGAGGSDVATGVCNEGDKRACHVTLGQHDGVLSCFVGIQFCVDGAWSTCGDGQEVTKVPADDGKPQALSEETVCEDNPCDPRCSKWVEDGKWKADGKVCKWPWYWSNDPKAAQDKADKDGAAKEPCTHGSDCHQNQKCQDPSQGACSHDICTKGDGLQKGCETKCVDKICESKPQCCEKLYEGKCESEPCLVYDKGLTKDCDPDVTKVCDWDKTCCPYTQWETCAEWGVLYYKQVCDWIEVYNCGWRQYYYCGWRWTNQYNCGWRWDQVYNCGWHWLEHYKCGWRWNQQYLCGWKWFERTFCGWRWRQQYYCGWRWIENYYCGWRYITQYYCGWRWYYQYTCGWRSGYLCGWRWQQVYVCGWQWQYQYNCYWYWRQEYICGWRWVETYKCGWRYKQNYVCGWRWEYVYTCGWHWVEQYYCGWRWKEDYFCGWRWIEVYNCGWQWVEVQICGWRWEEVYLCGWHWQEIYLCGWRDHWVCGWVECNDGETCYDCWLEYGYDCWWEGQYVYECWWDVQYVQYCWYELQYQYNCWWDQQYTYDCWWVQNYVYDCWWEQVYTYDCWWDYQYNYNCWWDWVFTYDCWWEQTYQYDCWWEQRYVQECYWQYVYVYTCWWDMQYVYNCWWSDYTYDCWWEYVYNYDCWWESFLSYQCWWEQQYKYDCWWEQVYDYYCWSEVVYDYTCWWETYFNYECWSEQMYVYDCWWTQNYVYQCWWEEVFTYDCWWEEQYECWWDLAQECWLEPVYGWIFYPCEKSYDGQWDQHCVDQYKEYAPGACPMSWKGDWDSTCINAVHDICHDYCDGVNMGSGNCEPWNAPDYDDRCGDFELGVGLTCKDGGTNIIPICNTGSKDAPSGIPLAILPKGSGYFGSDPDMLNGAKYCYTNEVIPPGECRNVTTCDVMPGEEVMVNPKSNSSHDANECFTGDNWGFFYDDTCGYPPNCPGGFLDTTKTEVYESTCDAGQTPQWGFLSWDATNKAGEIAFRVRTAATKADLTNATWASVSTKSTSMDPDCLASGPAPCPVDLYTTLGQASAKKKVLELEVSITPAADKKSTPTLEQWQVTYTCVESL